MTSKTRKTRSQFITDTAWTPAIAAGAALAVFHVYDHGVIGGILSISQVAAVIVVSMLFGFFRKKRRQGAGIWLGRLVGYGVLGMVYQTIMGTLAAFVYFSLIKNIDGLEPSRLVLYLSVEFVGMLAIAAPGLCLFFSRPNAGDNELSGNDAVTG